MRAGDGRRRGEPCVPQDMDASLGAPPLTPHALARFKGVSYTQGRGAQGQ